MISYGEESISGKAPGVILLSHGPLAKGLVQSAELIVGPSSDVVAYCLEAGDDVNDYRALFSKGIEAMGDTCTVLVDLQGGSPWNQLMYYATQTGKRLQVITGMNLPMVLTVLTSRDAASGEELSQECTQGARDGIVHPDLALLFEDDEDEDEDD